MAHPSLRLAHNAPGDFFVDSTCIDCDTCRWMAPDTFLRREGQASVARQPATLDELRAAERALLSCPTASIGTVEKHDLAAARASLPLEVEDGVHHCGYHAESSFGAASYLIVRAAGNVLVDSPRYTRGLADRLEALGGVDLLFLTHRDDVADHARWRERFGCERVLHADDRRAGTADVEHFLHGRDPVQWDDELRMLPTPGHTEGSTCLSYRGRFLFTGDHLAWSRELGHLYGFRTACWYSWPELVRSTASLLDEPFEWVLPGHGRRAHLAPGTSRAELERALAWMRS